MNSAVFFLPGDVVSQEGSMVSRERSQQKDSHPSEPPVSVVCC